MDTQRWIDTLAADADLRATPIWRTLAIALLIAVPVSAAILMAILGLRPDLSAAMRSPLFDLKLAVTSALAFSTIAAGLHLSRPEASLAGWGWLLLSPVAILVLGIAGEMLMPQRAPMLTRLVGNNAMLCLVAIPLLSLPLLAATLIALRRGATSRPAMLGAIAGLAAAGLAGTIYAAHCADDSPLFVATWYTLAAAAVAALGAIAGSRWLRY